jgi:hypothetical protein
MGGRIAYHSAMMRDLLFLLDFDPAIVGYSTDTITIEHEHEGEMITHTPDLLVQTQAYTAMVDCIPRSRYTQKAARRTRLVVRGWAAQHGGTFEYLAFTGDHLQAQRGSYLNNVKLLTEYAQGTVQHGIRARIYAILDAPPPTTSIRHRTVTIGMLRDELAFYTSKAALATIYHLTYHRELLIPLVEPLTEGTPVYLPHQQPASIMHPPPELQFPRRAGDQRK